jgi:excisionase family DNA binding protein
MSIHILMNIHTSKNVLTNMVRYDMRLTKGGTEMEKRMEKKMEKLLTVPEAAEALRVSVNTIRAWVYQRRIRVGRVGRKLVFKESDLIKIVERGFQDTKVV